MKYDASQLLPESSSVRLIEGKRKEMNGKEKKRPSTNYKRRIRSYLLQQLGAIMVQPGLDTSLSSIPVPPPLPGTLSSQHRIRISLVYRPNMLTQVIRTAQNSTATRPCTQKPHCIAMITRPTHVTT